jgi:PAS domain S-box-containing protein
MVFEGKDWVQSVEFIRSVENALAGLTGTEFFRALVRSLAHSLDVTSAFVTEIDLEASTADPLAFWYRDGFRQSKCYPLAGTPCESVLQGSVVAFERSVPALFPDDRGLIDLGAESFLAIPLKDAESQVLGHLALFDSRPRNWDEADLATLQLFATRARAELQRRRFEIALQETNRALETRVEERTRALSDMNDRLLHEVEQERRLRRDLTQSESLFRSLFDDSPASIWEMDLSAVHDLVSGHDHVPLRARIAGDPSILERMLTMAVVRRINRATLTLFGVDDPRVLVSDLAAMVVPSTWSFLADFICDLAAGRSHGSSEVTYARPGGGEVRVLVRWTVPEPHAHDWARVLFTMLDIGEQARIKYELERAREDLERRVGERTASLSAVNTRLRHEVASRLKAEAEARERELAYRDLYENAPNVYWSTGVDGLIKRVNRQVEGLLGWRPDEVVGRPLLDFLADTPHGKPKALEVLGRFRRGIATLNEEVQFVHRDGGVLWVSVNVVPVLDEDGRPVVTRSVITDISARKEAELALERRLELERLVAFVSRVFASASLGDLDGVFPVALERIRLELGFEAASITLLDEAMGRQRWEVGGANSDAGVVTTRMPIVHAGEELGALELMQSTGTSGMADADASLLRVLTEIMAATLARLASEAELVRARRIAESASQAKSEFLASMSHELRTPLNVILGYAQVLQRDERLGADAVRSLAVMQRSGEHLLMLIDDVLHLARVEAGRTPLDLRPAQLRGLLTEIADMFRVRAAQARLRFELVASPLPERVVCDERRLRQVLINLLGNAVKFSPVGSLVTLRVHAEPALGSAWCFVFEVIDQGVGIAPEDVERIFEPFRQLGHGRDGVGLGLSITRKLVEAMAGAIEVVSAPGRGSTFTVRIELDSIDTPQLTQRQTARIASYAGARRRVLVVDDREENRLVQSQLLELLGFQVDTAADGRSALEQVAASRPDLVLVDLVMPGMDGFETVRRLRAEPGSHGLRIVAVSASAFDQDRQRSIEFGCDAFLVKPLKIEELTDTIGGLLGLDWEAPLAADGDGVGELSVAAREELRALARLGDVTGLEEAIQRHLASAPGDATLVNLGELVGRFDLDRLERVLDMDGPGLEDGV